MRGRGAGRAAAGTIAAAASLALAAACGSGGTAAAPAARTTGDPLAGDVRVLAAASLTEAFGRIAADVQAAHPRVRVRVQFGASSTLARQVVAGDGADVLATASPATLRTASDAGELGAPQTFATNDLEIATPPGNPAAVRGLGDLARPGLLLALCAEQVPCGAAAAEAFRRAGITPRPATREADVRAVLTKVELGEVDTGLVYRTDVRAAGTRVEGVPLRAAEQVSTAYPLAVTKASRNPAAAAAFVAAVLAPAGQRVLRDAGFGPP